MCLKSCLASVIFNLEEEMFEATPFLYEFIWALVGIIFYGLAARIVGYSRSSLIIKQVILHCLVLIKAVNDNIYSLNEIKYDVVRRSGGDEEEIRLTKEIDQQTLEMWRTNVIINIVNSFPNEFRSVVGFTSWQEAITKLEKFYEKGGAHGKEK
mgnify:CR=1 FL=1